MIIKVEGFDGPIYFQSSQIVRFEPFKRVPIEGPVI